MKKAMHFVLHLNDIGVRVCTEFHLQSIDKSSAQSIMCDIDMASVCIIHYYATELRTIMLIFV